MNESFEIESALYTGICIYNRLRKSIVEIEGSFVPLEDKIELGLYLGILHSQNSISSLLNETELLKGTKIDYKKLNNEECYELYNLYFKDIMDNVNKDTILDYFKWLLTKNIVIRLNNEYDFNINNFIDTRNKQLIKK